MSGNTDLDLLLASASPALASGHWVFVTVRDFGEAAGLDPLGVFREDEAITVICSRERAVDAGLEFEGTYRQITFQIHSSLQAVGFVAAIAAALAAAGVPCNAVAAYYHDHVFVPEAKAAQAMQVLSSLGRKKALPNNALEATATRWMEEVWRRRDLAVFDQLHAPHFVNRSPAGRGTDRESYRQSVLELFAAFPDWEAEIDDLVVDHAAGKVAVRWSAEGIHRGMFLGAPPSLRRIKFRGLEIVRIEGEQIVERWGEWDGLDLLEQLRGAEAG